MCIYLYTVYCMEFMLIYGFQRVSKGTVAAFFALYSRIHLNFTTLWANSADDKLMLFFHRK